MQKFTPLEYLKIDVASNFGLDKEDWSTRIQWFDDNEHQFPQLLQLIASGQSTAGTLLDKAEQPALFYAGLEAYTQAKKGEPISYPISLDATASGAQILAILIGCEKSAQNCNVISTGHREDLYSNAYKAMLPIVQDTAKITRQQLKDAIKH